MKREKLTSAFVFFKTIFHFEISFIIHGASRLGKWEAFVQKSNENKIITQLRLSTTQPCMIFQVKNLIVV